MSDELNKLAQADRYDEAVQRLTEAKAGRAEDIWNAMGGTTDEAFAEYLRVADVFRKTRSVRDRAREAMRDAKATCDIAETAMFMREHDLRQAGLCLRSRLTRYGETK